jgi:hypothetical protein
MKDKLMKLVEKLPAEHIALMLHHSGVDVVHELEAMDDHVQKDKSDWERIKAQPRKYSDIAKNKPNEADALGTPGYRGRMPSYLEDEEDGMGIGEG